MSYEATGLVETIEITGNRPGAHREFDGKRWKEGIRQFINMLASDRKIDAGSIKFDQVILAFDRLNRYHVDAGAETPYISVPFKGYYAIESYRRAHVEMALLRFVSDDSIRLLRLNFPFFPIDSLCFVKIPQDNRKADRLYVSVGRRR
jgi:hypothetical protein